MMDCIAVGLGGFLGSILRYLGGKIPLETHGFPLHTLWINVIGSFVIGCIACLVSKNPDIDPRWILFFKVGVCGGFTTFSTFSLESSQLIQSGQTGMAILYVGCSIVFGVIAVFVPQLLIK